MPYMVLPHGDGFGIIAKAFEKAVEPEGNVRAAPFHEVNFVLADDHCFQRLNLPTEFVGKTDWIDGIISVPENVLHLSAGKIVYHRAAHGELVKVVVREMFYYLAHCSRLCINSLKAAPPSREGANCRRTWKSCGPNISTPSRSVWRTQTSPARPQTSIRSMPLSATMPCRRFRASAFLKMEYSSP